MQVVVHQQGSQAWLDWRLHGIGSSDAMVIAAHHGLIEKKDWMKSLNDLFEEKMSGIDKVVENWKMRRGTENEPAARRKFEAVTGIVVQPVCAEMDATPEVRASFDGITFDGMETIEIKCPNEDVHVLAKAGEIVDYYQPQVCHQALVAWSEPDAWPEAAKVNFGSYVPERDDFALVRKPAAEFRDFAAALYRHELAFLEMLRSGVPPCGAEFASLATRYLELDVEIKRLTKAQEPYKAALTDIAKKRGETTQGAGVNVVRVERSGTVDWKRLAAEYNIGAEEIAKYRSKDSVSWQVRATPPAESVPASNSSGPEDPAKVIAGVTDPFWGTFAQQSDRQRAEHATKATPAKRRAVA